MAKILNSVKYCSERCRRNKNKMKTINLIFLINFFKKVYFIENEYDVYLIEEHLFFISFFINKRLLFTEQV